MPFDYSTDVRSSAQADIADAMRRKHETRALIDSAFPSQGSAKASHLGSQSAAPNKEAEIGQGNQYSMSPTDTMIGIPP